MRLKRARFAALLVSTTAAGAARLPVRAAATARVAWLSPDTARDNEVTFEAFRGGLESLGYGAGRNLTLDAHWANGSIDAANRLAREIVRLKPDVIVTQTRAVYAVKETETTLPVVFGFSGDPVIGKLVESVSHPGRNYTGVSMLSLELVGKRMQLLKELLPNLKHVAVLANPAHPGKDAELATSQDAAKSLDLDVRYFPVRTPVELEGALAALARDRSEAIVVFPDTGMMMYRRRIAAFSLANHIATLSGWAPFAEAGNLATYGPELRDAYRRLATYVDKILKGANPADLPVELPTKFELAINLRTAKALRVTVPQSILVRADTLLR